MNQWNTSLACLALAWAAWAGWHSLLARPGVERLLRSRLALSRPAYRLAYSLLSLLTLAPVAAYARSLGGLRGGWWPGGWVALQMGMGLAGWGLLLWAWRSLRREGVDLLGWRELRRDLAPPPRLVTTGAYALSRHPMYLGAALALWARGTSPADLVTNLALTLYLALGAWHEESRLRTLFGPSYRTYARRVPFLLPLGRRRSG